MKLKVIILFLVVGVVFGGYFWLGRQQVRIENVILISMDTTRADYLSCYGYQRKTTPNIDALAAEGIRCEKVVSAAPITLPAHSSIMTGTNPPYNGVHYNLESQLPEDSVTLAEILQKQGFATGAVISAFVLDSQFKLDQGFDTYNDQFQQKHSVGLFDERKGDEATQVATQWLDEHKAKPFFYFLHYYDPHDGYDPPEPFAKEYRDNLYAGEIAFTDHCIGQVVDKLKELDLYESTLIIIVGDHGEMLGEHGEITHSYYIYESAVRVPLIFKVPGRNKAKTIESNVGIIDIVPTICGLLGIEPPDEAVGIDLSAFFKKGQPPAERGLYCESLAPTIYNANSLLGVVEGSYKYIQTTQPELYDLKKDRRESINLVNTLPQKARILQDKLAQILEQQVRKNRDDARANLDAEAVKRLESLGYVAGEISEDFSFDQSKPDPKDLFQLHSAVSRANYFVSNEMYEDAKRTLKELEGLYPGHSMIYNRLGEVGVITKDYDSAVRYFKLALESQPERPKVELYNSLGSALVSRGDYDEAAAFFNQALRLEPDDLMSLGNLGDVLQRQGHFDKSIEYCQKALELKSDHFEACFRLALALLKTGEVDKSMVYFQKALILRPDHPMALSYLSKALLVQNKIDESIEYSRMAIEVDPDLAEAHDSLATALARKNDFEGAIASYRKSLEIDSGQAPVLFNFGKAFFMMEENDKAINEWNRSLEVKPDQPDVHDHIAMAMMKMGRGDEAIVEYGKSLEIAPNRVGTLKSLAAAQLGVQRYDDAIASYMRLLKIEPEQPVINRIIADILYRQGKLDEAGEYYEAALKLKHDMPSAYIGLAEIHLAHDDLDKAVEHWRQALAIRPDLVGILNNLAWRTAVHRNRDFHDPDEAVRLAKRACELTGYKVPSLLDTLSVAYAAAGKFTDAVDIAEKAITMAAAEGKKKLADDIRKRLKLFKASQPYYENQGNRPVMWVPTVLPFESVTRSCVSMALPNRRWAESGLIRSTPRPRKMVRSGSTSPV